MLVQQKEGTLYSKVRCNGGAGCGNGKTLEMYNTLGKPSDEIVKRLEHTAEEHERRHPEHRTEVTIYRLSLEPVVEVLPLEKDMQERRAKYVFEQTG